MAPGGAWEEARRRPVRGRRRRAGEEGDDGLVRAVLGKEKA
jgi:hypothetical protein